MSSLLSTANILAVLSGGRRPAWTLQASSTGVPEGTPGVDLSDALLALVDVKLRAQEAYRTLTLTVTFAATTTYRVSINGTNHDSASPASASAAYLALATAINGGAVASVATATARDADGADASVSGEAAVLLEVVGDTNTDFYAAVSITSGSGTWASAVADPITANMKLWFMTRAATGYTSQGGWRAVNLNGTSKTLPLTVEGYLERHQVGGLLQAYVQISDVAGHASDSGLTYRAPTISIGPCVQE